MSRHTPHTLDDIRALVAERPGPDTAAQAAAGAREPRLTKPPGSLGRLEDLAAWLAAWQGRHPPRVESPHAVIFAGNHGVAARGVSAFPQSVTRQMVDNFVHGGAAVNQLCGACGVGLSVDELTLDTPTADFTRTAAMDAAECVTAFSFGLRALERDIDLLCVGEMGIANTTSAAAVASGLFDRHAADWTGPGTGVEGSALAHKVSVVEEGLARHRGHLGDPLEVLRRLGGRELAAMAGAVLAARLARVPVLLDGFVATAAAGVLYALAPDALDHCRVAHASAEPAHRRLVEAVDQEPLLDLGMRLGEASGAVLAVPLVRAAAACHAGMATFDEAGVDGG